VGPSYLGIFGRKTKLADGREIVADEEYLNRSIENPAADLVEGYPAGLMPKLPLTPEERATIVEYLKTLR
jgi:cytochrome c oxidase subunit 2